MYEITERAVITADAATAWNVSTDVDNWASWDPHEQAARLDGPFVAGATGWSKPRGGPATDWTVTEVTEHRRWASRCALPGGALAGENTFEPIGTSRLRCTRTVRVSGPLVVLFRVFFGPRMRRDMRRSFAALEYEVARRAEQPGR
jgi:hypothetical protein